MDKIKLFIFLIALLFFYLGSLAYLNHQEYKFCKTIGEICDANCSYFGEKNYNVYCDSEIKKVGSCDKEISSFDFMCKDANITMIENSTSRGLAVISCVKDKIYWIILNVKYEKVNVTIPSEIPYFRNNETNEIYLVENDSLNILLEPYESAILIYEPNKYKKEKSYE